ncbi:MAG: hypothetical protein WDN45_01070 [Caulobacteraceae bacterium]
MANLDDRLAALASADSMAALDGLEDQVWTKVQARKAASAAGSTVRVALTGLALAGGLAFGALHHTAAPAQTHVAELGVLSEDGLLAPSVRLGGGA